MRSAIIDANYWAAMVRGWICVERDVRAGQCKFLAASATNINEEYGKEAVGGG